MSMLRALSQVLLFMIACAAAWAQQPYPSKPVRVVIVFPPGGATDIVGRIVFQKVGEQMNQQFVIDNRAGAGGTIGATMVAKSPPDGYTLMVYSATLVANAHLYRKLPYDALKDFTGITTVSRLVGLLTVHPSMPVHTVPDLIALAKKRPGDISYGSAGVGAFQHLSTSYFTQMANIRMVHVPFKGGAPASASLAAGEIQLILTPVSEVLPHIQSHRVRPIAVSSDKRITQMPEIPTIGETVKGYEFTSWFGTFVPAGTARPIIDRLNAEIHKALADPAVLSNLNAQVLDPMYLTADDFAKKLKAEYDKYERVVKDSGARLD
ncbi:MAG TPA: tripartite tricarboxylate transporter substrate binding protein [Burkholderiales bacterium]|nr:tripartite tricarboxylate transporter substrate binding protein [Burkholderiales bacterium]